MWYFPNSNFLEDEIVSMFYMCGLHVLCIVPMLIIHLHVRKHDVGEGWKDQDVQEGVNWAFLKINCKN
jgi:hypothetical protein